MHKYTFKEEKLIDTSDLENHNNIELNNQIYDITSKDFNNWVERSCPYIQVEDDPKAEKSPYLKDEKKDNAKFDSNLSPDLLTLANHWSIQYWPSEDDFSAAMSLSASLHSIVNVNTTATLEELKAKMRTPFRRAISGSIINQAFSSAAELVMLAIHHRWNCIKITEGTEFVKWAVWAVASENKINVINYEPTEKQKKKHIELNLLSMIFIHTKTLYQPLTNHLYFQALVMNLSYLTMHKRI